MPTPDVNVLLAAFRADHPQHAVARSWMLQQLADAGTGARLGLLPMVCVSFVRLATHPRIFAVPATAEEALAFLDALLATPGCELHALGAEWPAFAASCRAHAPQGNLVQHVWIAAAARAAGARLVTFDHDFEALLAPHERELLRADA